MDYMVINRNLISTQLLINIKNISAKHLPIGHSFIPYEILITVFYYHCRGEDLTIKTLFNSGVYSDMGNRYHFRRLIEKGWIEVANDQSDARNKLIKATEKLQKSFTAITAELSAPFGDGMVIKFIKN